MAKFCYLSYDLDDDPRFGNLKDSLGLAGEGAFFEAYKEIRKNGGKAPLDFLVQHLRKLRFPRKKALLMLTQFELFRTDEHDTVSLNINLAQPEAPDRRQLSLFPEEDENHEFNESNESFYMSTEGTERRKR